ncbi:alginate O-acetyltransferase AlgX-related protein [Actinoalloteichus hymeniacidonis]|uniref:alginate O-acetyltransferase AlgX-related protein n=1 Tax=Actinoalloteichus hymeniacidonis TaxID=340345 RepID=UPI0012FA94E1|nr:hypothetical protein [Actinoalloteichus hymeniacidonis]MBB5910778.1 hypothetical protein [Actinoalloteichus hymeniacidonis]
MTHLEGARGATPESLILPEVHESWLPREHSLYRPRHGGRQLIALLAGVVFFAAPLAVYGMGVRATEIENRPLVAFPGFADGWGFFTGMPQWAVDNLVFRESAIRLADGISRGVFGEPPGRGIPDQPAGPAVLPQPPAPSPPSEESTDLTEQLILAESSEVIEGKDGWLYLGYDVEGKCDPYRDLDQSIASLRELRRVVEESGRELIVLIAPDKSTIVPEYLPDEYPDLECARVATEDFWARVPAETGALDLRAALRQPDPAPESGRPAYHLMDTHWTDEGAIEATRALAEQISPGSSDSWLIDRQGRWDHTPDLAVMQGRIEAESGTRYRLRPDGTVDRTGPRINRLDEAVHFSSPATTGMVTERVAMLGDSFMVSTSRYLPAAFADLRLINYTVAQSDRQAMLDVLVAGDVIVVQSVERLIAGGVTPFLDPGVVADIGAALAEHPRP